MPPWLWFSTPKWTQCHKHAKLRNYNTTIQQIVDLYKIGISVPEITEKISLPYTSVRAILIRSSINETAPLPLNTKDIEDAYSFYNYCQLSVFDSEATYIFPPVRTTN